MDQGDATESLSNICTKATILSIRQDFGCRLHAPASHVHKLRSYYIFCFRISKQHAILENKNGEVTLKPFEGHQVLHNGKELTKPTALRHQDRIRFGSNNLFVFVQPLQALELRKKRKQLREITFEFAQSEIAKNSGLELDDGTTSLRMRVDNGSVDFRL